MLAGLRLILAAVKLPGKVVATEEDPKVRPAPEATAKAPVALPVNWWPPSFRVPPEIMKS